MEKVIVNVNFENNYGAYLDLLPGCVAVAHSLEDLKKDIAKAIQMHLDGMKKDNDPIPVELQGEYELIMVFV
jgi:predicted RNase H-like HicB family nuclease